jgi:hypothetical protein
MEQKCIECSGITALSMDKADFARRELVCGQIGDELRVGSTIVQ